jgi:ketosteroid isomerase-like protein
MNAVENKQALVRCIELYHKSTIEWVDNCYSRKLEWIELPTQSMPQGRKDDFAFYRESVKQLLRLFPDCKLKVIRSIAENDCVVLEQDWQGTAAFSVGNYVAGRVARLRVASFFTLENGLIVKQIDYCTSVN